MHFVYINIALPSLLSPVSGRRILRLYRYFQVRWGEKQRSLEEPLIPNARQWGMISMRCEIGVSLSEEVAGIVRKMINYLQ